jgi:hypothetical protein
MRWVIGDIHGMLRPLTTVIAQVRKVDADCRFIFVGDYINRGPNSKGVIDLLLSLDNASFIRGNHDDIFDLVINGQCYADNATRGNRVAAFHWFMKYGLDNTLLSYGCDVAMLERVAARCTDAHLDELAASVPETHRRFIRNLPAAHEEADLFVVHGKWDPDELAEKPGIVERLEKHPKLRHRLLWGRYTEEELARVKAWQRTGYFGHTPVSFYANLAKDQPTGGPPRMLPVAGNKMVLLDTAAALGVDGRLSAFCSDSGALIQSDHFGALIVE